MERHRTAILISGRGSNMTALIEAAARPSYPAEIALVLSECGRYAAPVYALGALVGGYAVATHGAPDDLAVPRPCESARPQAPLGGLWVRWS